MKTKQYKAVYLGSNEECVYTNDSNERHIIRIEIYSVFVEGYSRVIGQINDNWYDDDGDVYKSWQGDLEEMFGISVDFQELISNKRGKLLLVEENFLDTLVYKCYSGDNKVYETDDYFVAGYLENYLEMIHEILNK